MKHLSVHRRALGVGAAAVLLLTACSDDTTGDGDSGLSYTDSPLAEYMSSVYDRDADAEAAAETAAQEAVAQCMAEQGFDYTIPEAAPPGPFEVGFDQDVMDTESWVADNGYGLSLIYAETAEPVSDSNDDYVASLSDASKGQYYAALYGTYSDGMTAEELETYVATSAEQGCWGLGEVEGFTPEYLDDPAAITIFEATEKVQNDLQDDPAVVEANEKWADCMADAGFTGLAVKEDAVTALGEEYSEMYYPTDTDASGAAPTPQELADLREREISTALADRTCTEETGYDDAYLTALYAAEEQFIVDHKSELDALVAEYGG